MLIFDRITYGIFSYGPRIIFVEETCDINLLKFDVLTPKCLLKLKN